MQQCPSGSYLKKRDREQEGEEDDCYKPTKLTCRTETFVYFGITGFITTEFTATQILPETVTKGDVEDLYLKNDDEKLRWNTYTFIHFITGENNRVTKKHKHTNAVNVKELQFTKHVDEHLRIYVYVHHKYTRCSKSKWSDWKAVFTFDDRNNFTVTKTTFSGCELYTMSRPTSDYLHACLLPYCFFAIRVYLKNSSHMQSHMHLAKF